MAQLIVPANADGSVLACENVLSFWGGIDIADGRIIDKHHDQFGQSVSNRVVMMPTSRGSCSGSSMLLDLAINGRAPAALIFCEDEGILTLGAMVARRLFGLSIAIVRLTTEEYTRASQEPYLTISDTKIEGDQLSIPLNHLAANGLNLSTEDREMLDGDHGDATRIAMETLCDMAALQSAARMIDVTRVHIDGCIYASPANLIFAERMADLGSKVRVPTTTNAISVDYDNWRAQQIPDHFGGPASQLADAYVRMGATASFTCAPYYLDHPPVFGENIGWSESNAVIYANSVVGARTTKHPDFLDLFIGLTGRAPEAGVYLDEQRRPRRVIEVERPDDADESLWPLLGWLVGTLSPDRIPVITGLEGTNPLADDLRALCAAFGTTSAAPMLHVAGITPESHLPPMEDADRVLVGRDELSRTWNALNTGGPAIDLVSFGSPHFSLTEIRALVHLLEGRRRHGDVSLIVTVGRDVLAAARADGLIDELTAAGARVVPDICWCSISEPVLPPSTRTLMTNSGKYAHYAPALCGREVRFGSLADCVEAAITGEAPTGLPSWLQ